VKLVPTIEVCERGV